MNTHSKSKIIYVDIYHGGHHLSYTKRIIQSLLDSECEVHVITKEESAWDSFYHEFAASYSGRVCFYPIYKENAVRYFPQIFSVWLGLFSSIKEIERLSKHKFTGAILPNATQIFKSIAIFGSPFGKLPFSSLIISGIHILPSKNFGFRKIRAAFHACLFLKFLRKKTLMKSFTIEREFEEYFRYFRAFFDSSKHEFSEQPIISMEPMDRSKSRKTLGLADGKLTILAFGSLTRRKGIETLVAAAADPRICEKIQVLVAGVPDERVSSFLASPRLGKFRQTNTIITKLKYLNDADEAAMFAAADIIWVGYIDFLNTSGVLQSAYQNAKPVIGCNVGAIAESIKNLNTGLTIDPKSPEQALNAIAFFLDNPSERENWGINGLKSLDLRGPQILFEKLIDAVNVREA